MMHNIIARNVNGALHDGLWWLKVAGVAEASRNGPVLVSPGPVLTEYLRPVERVLFSAARDANPYFHLMEALWMLAGRRDLAFVQAFNGRMAEFSDNGFWLQGAYGYRWRRTFGRDQLLDIVRHLRAHPESRRAVLSMWSPAEDLGRDSKDLPCNTHAYFDLRSGALNMTVCCRSNDALLGAYGANAVHFSVLQEYLAAHLGTRVGVYRQFSNNFHVYTDMAKYPSHDPAVIGCDDRYATGEVKPFPLIMGGTKVFDLELMRFMSDPLGDTAYEEPFFDRVAAPMYASWHDRKAGTSGKAGAEAIDAADWRVACMEWIARRTEKQQHAA